MLYFGVKEGDSTFFFKTDASVDTIRQWTQARHSDFYGVSEDPVRADQWYQFISAEVMEREIQERYVPEYNAPLGIAPRFVWEEQRISELKAAISRFMNANMTFPMEWAQEFNELIQRRTEDITEEV